MVFLYSLSVRLYGLLLKLASPFSKKARQWTEGRKGLFERLKAQERKSEGKKEGWVWMHCSSLGEFEQGRPLLDALKREHPELGICLSFFSPSGYEARKDKGDADIVIYMPLDTPANARRFVQLLRPDLALFVKYELWYHHLMALKEMQVPIYLIAAVFRSDHRYFRWYGGIFRKMLRSLDGIHVQEERSQALLQEIGIDRVSVSGDPRYDRVWQIAQEAGTVPMVEAFKGEAPLLIGGSSWPSEEALLKRYLDQGPQELKLLLAPHDVGGEHVRSIEGLFKGSSVLRYSDDPSDEELKAARVLLIDRIGLLAALYRYGDFAFVGGGFSGALHNILEPIAHGLPVFFGPKVGKFPEAAEMIEEGVAFSIRDADELADRFRLYLEDEEERKALSEKARKAIERRKGASEQILGELEAHLS